MPETFREDPEPPGAGDGGQGTWREGVDDGTSRESGAAGGVGFARAVLLPCLSDRFTVMGGLPAGGESDVLLVADQAGSRWVVKQYRRPGWSPSMDVLDLLEDLKVGHSLQSWVAEDRTRHLVWLREWGTDPSSGLFFEVQEFVAGGALASGGAGRVGAGGGSSISDWPAGVFAEALIDAVAGFHRLVGAHRDLKPGNLLVRSADPLVLVVADVGLSRNVGETSHRFSKRDGSPAYQAPEAAAQGKVSRAGDWWAVGVMIAEAVLGRHPLAQQDGSLPDDRVLLTEVVERDIPLDGVQDSRLRLLCEGLLTRDSEQRWRLPQISAWRAGESPKTGYARGQAVGGPVGSVGGPVRTVLFAGVEYDSPRGLAAAFAADPGRAGELLFLARDQVLLEDLRLMLGAHGLHEAQGYVSSYRSGVWQPSFLRLLVEMDPNLPPELAGQSMTPGAIADLAVEVLGAGELTESQRESVRWVVEHDVWRLWRRLPGMSEAPEAAGRLMGFAPADGVGMCESAPVDTDTMGRFWDEAAGLGQAWMLWWAVDPTTASQRLNAVLEPLRSAGEVTDQTWWHELASTDPSTADGMGAKRSVAALLSHPQAQILQRESDQREARARDDIAQVRAVLLERLERQGEAYLAYLRDELSRELQRARRPAMRGTRDKRLRAVWARIVNTRGVLRDRYGMHFAPIMPDSYDRAPDKVALIVRELDRAPERRGWDGSEDPGWVVPAPLLVGLIGGRTSNVVVDPLLGEIVGSWTEGGRGGGFRRSQHGRILLGEPLSDPLGNGSEWSASGDVAMQRPVSSRTWTANTAERSGVVVLRVPKEGAFTIEPRVTVYDVCPMSMPDGSAVAVVLSPRGVVRYWDLRARVLLRLPALEMPGASAIDVPPWDSPDWAHR